MRELVIVGGGLAGVLVAKSVLNLREGWRVTIVEDPKYRGKGGIKGESLTPSFVAFVQEQLGYENTTEWLVQSNAATKLGGVLEGWGREDIYISQDMYRKEAMPIGTWLRHSKHSKDPQKDLLGINALCFPAVALMKELSTPDFDVDSPLTREDHDWSVNLDVSLLAEYLLKDLHDTYLTTHFRYVALPVLEVKVSGEGVQSIEVPGESIKGELYVDATGLARVLTKAVGVDTEPQAHRFPNDRAVYGKIGCKPRINYVRSVTANAGWIWEIPLHSETSVGYVYSSRFISDAEALKELIKEYPEVKGSKVAVLAPDRLKAPWTKNVVAVGASQGIIDPLEANVLLQTKTHVQSLVKELTSPALGYLQASKFNRACKGQWEGAISFVEMHYRGCVRRDTEYWRYVTSIPHASKGLEDFLVHYTSSIDGRDFDWEKWVILAAGLQLIDINTLKG